MGRACSRLSPAPPRLDRPRFVADSWPRIESFASMLFLCDCGALCTQCLLGVLPSFLFLPADLCLPPIPLYAKILFPSVTLTTPPLPTVSRHFLGPGGPPWRQAEGRGREGGIERAQSDFPGPIDYDVASPHPSLEPCPRLEGLKDSLCRRLEKTLDGRVVLGRYLPV